MARPDRRDRRPAPGRPGLGDADDRLAGGRALVLHVLGEAREADLGVASGNGKGQIFVKGQVIKTVPEAQIVETLIEEAMRIAEGMEAEEGAGAQVSVS